MPRDLAGSFNIPEHLLKRVADAMVNRGDDILQNLANDFKEEVSAFNWKVLLGKTKLGDWKDVAKIRASNNTSTHTVRARRLGSDQLEMECSCQSFRIQKKPCKHIKSQVEEWQGLGLVPEDYDPSTV